MTEQKESLPRHLLSGMLIVTVLALLTLFAARKGLLESWESVGLDSFLGSHNFQSNVVIVNITEEEYNDRDLFNGKSPLAPDPVKRLLGRIAAYNPKAILVDLDLGESSVTVANAVNQIWQSQHPQRPLPPPIVWPQITTQTAEAAMPEIESVPNYLDVIRGVPLFRTESDGSVRTLSKEIVVRDPDGCRLWSTMPQAALIASKGGDPRPLNAACNEKEVSASSMLRLSNAPQPFVRLDASSIINAPDANFASTFDGNFVVVGGTFSEARDMYQTAVGLRPGVDLMAFGIETLSREKKLYGGAIFAFVIDLAVGFCILGVGYYFKPSPVIAVGASIATALVLPVACSYLVFQSGNYWIGFFPVIAGALVHIAYDTVKELRKKEETIRELEAKVSELSAAAKKAPQTRSAGA